MVGRPAVAAWLNAYVSAWKSYDPQAIGNLFSEDAVYALGTFGPPTQGCDAIVASWLREPDPPGTYDATYEPIAVEEDRAVTHGRTHYFEPDGATLKAEYDNIFVLRFDADGRCTEFREWFLEVPQDKT